jgi:hypothetical protein
MMGLSGGVCESPERLMYERIVALYTVHVTTLNPTGCR